MSKWTIGLTIIGLILTACLAYKEGLETRNNINYKLSVTKSNEITAAIVDLRAVNEKERFLFCENTHKYPKDIFYRGKLAVQMERFNVRAALTKANINSDYLLNKEVYEKVKNFTVWDASIKDLCPTDSPSDKEWLNKEGEINSIMKETLASRY